jgi:TPR repeat protein
MNVSRLVKAVPWLVLAGVAAGCGGGNAGSAVRPSDPTASNALGESASSSGGSAKPDPAPASCSDVPATAEPLVVDWSTKDQVDLSVAMANNVAVVSYGCKSLRFLRNCTAKGKYAFTAVPSIIEEAVKIQDADEAKASLPFSGGSIGASLQRGSAIDIALAYVGKRVAADNSVSKADLSGGECAQATHFVRRATVGAFVMQTGTKGQVQAAAELFGAGASGSSVSNKSKLSSSGTLTACKSITDGAPKPPDGCAAILRLDLQALSDEPPRVVAEAPLANVCPDGFVTSTGGACVKKENARSFRCDMTDPQECKDQCKKGNADSCFNAATIAKGHDPEPVTIAFFKKACDGGVMQGCYLGGKLSQGNDWPGAEQMLKRGCSLGSPDACNLLASNIYNSPIKGTRADQVAYYTKVCDLGQWRSPTSTGGCIDAVQRWFNGVAPANGDPGVPAQPEQAIKLLTTYCDGSVPDACFMLRNIHRWGLLTSQDTVTSPDAPKYKKDPEKAAALETKYCGMRGHDDDICKKMKK